MSKIAGISESANEMERLIADLSESGPIIFVFGVGWWTAHLIGATAPVFRGPADRRWWHVDLGDDTASWTMDVRVDEITGVRFVREPYPFPSLPRREVLTVQFLGPGGDTVLSCYMHELYDGQRMRPEKRESPASIARALRQPRRVEGRSRHPLGPGCLNHRDQRPVGLSDLANGLLTPDLDNPGRSWIRQPFTAPASR